MTDKKSEDVMREMSLNVPRTFSKTETIIARLHFRLGWHAAKRHDPDIAALVEALKWYDGVHRLHWAVNLNDLEVKAKEALERWGKK